MNDNYHEVFEQPVPLRELPPNTKFRFKHEEGLCQCTYQSGDNNQHYSMVYIIKRNPDCKSKLHDSNSMMLTFSGNMVYPVYDDETD